MGYKDERTENNGNTQHADDNDDSVEEHLKYATIIEAPDGGYGWVVLFAGFCCNVIVDGIIFTAPETLLPLWENENNAKYDSMSIGCALLAGCYLLIGPFASILANIYGCNKVAILGAFLASLGFLLSAVAQYQFILFLTFGIIAGSGLGFVFLSAVISVSTYFNKRRALATGISFCGSGIGTAIISLLNPWIVSQLPNNSWRLYCVFLSILTLTLAFFGYLFKPLKPSKKQLDEVARITSEYISRQELHPDSNNFDERKDSLIQNFPRQRGSVSRHLSVNRPFLSTIDLNISRHQGEKTALSQQNLAEIASKESMAELNRPLSKIDIFYPGSVTSLSGRKKSIVATKVDQEPEDHPEMYLSAIGLPTQDDYVDKGFKLWIHKYINQLKSFLDISLLKSPSFVILAISGFLTLAAFFIPFIYVQQFALSRGIEKKEAKYLVTIIGLVNTAGRIICGGIADSPRVDSLTLSNVLIIIGGIATILLPFFNTFIAFVVYCVLFALGVASFAALRSVISADLLGMERLTNAYGFLMLFMGMAALIGPPFASFLKNKTGSYGIAFHVMGCFMTLSGLISVPLRQINKWERKRFGREDVENAPAVELEPMTDE